MQKNITPILPPAALRRPPWGIAALRAGPYGPINLCYAKKISLPFYPPPLCGDPHGVLRRSAPALTGLLIFAMQKKYHSHFTPRRFAATPMGLDTQAPYIFVPLDFYPQDKNPAPEGVRRSAPALTGLLIFAMQKKYHSHFTRQIQQASAISVLGDL